MTTIEAPRRNMEQTPSAASRGVKRIRSQPPDAIVIVGKGDKRQEFPCYKLMLALASDFFDNAFASTMNEGETGRVELEDKNPDEWKEVYTFIDPFTYPDASSSMTPEVALRLLPFFDFLQMTAVINVCDAVLCKEVPCLTRLFLRNAEDGIDSDSRVEIRDHMARVYELAEAGRKYRLRNTNKLCTQQIEEILLPKSSDIIEANDVQWIISFSANSDLEDSLRTVLISWIKKWLPANLEYDDNLLSNTLLPHVVFEEIRKQRFAAVVNSLPRKAKKSLEKARVESKTVLGGMADIIDDWTLLYSGMRR